MQLARFLNMKDSSAKLAASRHQLMRIIALGTANYHHCIGLPSDFHGGRLSLFGGLADRITKLDLRLREAFLNEPHQVTNFEDRLSRLSHDAETRPFLKTIHICFRKNYVNFIQVFGHAANFHMISFSNDHGVISCSPKCSQGTMCQVHQRTRGLKHV